jgi:hypothetical protein
MLMYEKPPILSLYLPSVIPFQTQPLFFMSSGMWQNHHVLEEWFSTFVELWPGKKTTPWL